MQSPPSFATVSRLKQRYGDPDLAVPMEEIDTSRTLLDLDDDLLIHIAEYLPPHRVLAIAQTCNRWSGLSKPLSCVSVPSLCLKITRSFSRRTQTRRVRSGLPSMPRKPRVESVFDRYVRASQGVQLLPRCKTRQGAAEATRAMTNLPPGANTMASTMTRSSRTSTLSAVQCALQVPRRRTEADRRDRRLPSVEQGRLLQGKPDTAGGTTFTLDGRWGGHGLDPTYLEELFFEVHPEFDQDKDYDYYEKPEYQDLVDKMAKEFKEGFEEICAPGHPCGSLMQR